MKQYMHDENGVITNSFEGTAAELAFHAQITFLISQCLLGELDIKEAQRRYDFLLGVQELTLKAGNNE